MKELIAQSKNYKLFGEFETATLEGPGITQQLIVGDFYGDVACGCIDSNEKWCVVGGDSIVIYQIAAPFRNYGSIKKTDQWQELWRYETGWDPEIVYQIDSSIIRVVIDVFSSQQGVYDVNVETLEIIKRV
jgi:hypothetical protein